MKKNNNDLIVGLTIFIALFMLIAGVLWLKEVSISRKLVKYTILFPQIGTLQKGDPVKVNGLKRGNVFKIHLYKSKVAVEIKLDKDVHFTDSSTVTVQNIGLMGERTVGITLSEKGKPFIPDTKDSITYIEGNFDSGIAEAMGMMGDVLNEVTELVDTVEKIIYVTVGDEQFIRFFHTIVGRFDTLVTMVEDLIVANQSEITNSIKNIHEVSTHLKELINENRTSVTNIISDGNQLTTEALAITATIDSITETLHRIITDIENGEGAIGMLLEDSTVVENLQKSLIDLDTLVRDINENGLKLRVKLFGNKKYFEKENE